MGGAVTAVMGAAKGMGEIYQGVAALNSAKSQNRQDVWKSFQEMETRKQEILKIAAKQKTQYVGGGIELEGSAQAVIQDTYNIGKADIAAIGSNYKQAMKNRLKEAKTKLITSIISGGQSTYQGFSDSGLFNQPKDVTGQAQNIANSSNGQITFTNASYKG